MRHTAAALSYADLDPEISDARSCSAPADPFQIYPSSCAPAPPLQLAPEGDGREADVGRQHCRETLGHIPGPGVAAVLRAAPLQQVELEEAPGGAHPPGPAGRSGRGGVRGYGRQRRQDGAVRLEYIVSGQCSDMDHDLCKAFDSKAVSGPPLHPALPTLEAPPTCRIRRGRPACPGPGWRPPAQRPSPPGGAAARAGGGPGATTRGPARRGRCGAAGQRRPPRRRASATERRRWGPRLPWSSSGHPARTARPPRSCCTCAPGRSR